MMKYLDQCESARESGLVKKLDPFPHFMDTARQFSMTDMELIRDGRLLPQLQHIHQDFSKHIRQICKVGGTRIKNDCDLKSALILLLHYRYMTMGYFIPVKFSLTSMCDNNIIESSDIYRVDT